MPKNMPAFAKHPGIKVPQGQGGWYVSPSRNKNYHEEFTAQTVVTILGTTHNFNTVNITVTATDATDPTIEIPATIVIDPTTFDVEVTFAGAESGNIRLLTVGGNG